ncbi:MAG: mechanosensitive ion channel family protein [Methyloligellaceae bacterium]
MEPIITAVNKTPDPGSLKMLYESWVSRLVNYLSSFNDIWSIIQFGIIAGSYVLAIVVAQLITPWFENQIRKIQGQPALLRLLSLLLRRVHLISFVILLWCSAFLIKSITWPSRAYFILIAANLVTAWIIIAIASRLIRNRMVANLVATFAWSIAALNILGLLDETLIVLDLAAISFGDSRISLLNVTQVIILFGALMWVAVALTNSFENYLKTNAELTPSVQVLISKITKIALITFAILISLTTAGINLTTLTVFSGAIGLGIGIGLQKVVSNLISGIIILMDKSIKPGDVISLDDKFGWITTLHARYVSVITRDGLEHLIPNEDLITQQVINWSHSNRNVRLDITFGVSYEANPHEIRKLAVDAVTKLERALEDPKAVCHVTAFGESSIDFILRFWIEDPENGLTNIRGQAFLAIWDAFKENDIVIPYPHREVIIRERG